MFCVWNHHLHRLALLQWQKQALRVWHKFQDLFVAGRVLRAPYPTAPAPAPPASAELRRWRKPVFSRIFAFSPHRLELLESGSSQVPWREAGGLQGAQGCSDIKGHRPTCLLACSGALGGEELGDIYGTDLGLLPGPWPPVSSPSPEQSSGDSGLVWGIVRAPVPMLGRGHPPTLGPHLPAGTCQFPNGG